MLTVKVKQQTSERTYLGRYSSSVKLVNEADQLVSQHKSRGGMGKVHEGGEMDLA